MRNIEPLERRGSAATAGSLVLLAWMAAGSLLVAGAANAQVSGPPIPAVAPPAPPASAAVGGLIPDADPRIGPPPAGTQEEMIKKVGLDQRLNATIPLDIPFRDETGRRVMLGQYFGSKPVMLMLIQYRCRMLCSEEMNALLGSLTQMSFTPGNQFELLTISIDPRETPELAAAKKKSYVGAYGRPEGAAGWHFLTGDLASIEALAKAIGYRYTYDARTDQFAHPDGVEILTPSGKIARYFFRLEYPAKDMRFGLIEAASNRIGTPIDAIALLCYHYDPSTGKYGVAIMALLQIVSIVTVLLLGSGLAIMKRRERRSARQIEPAALSSES